MFKFFKKAKKNNKGYTLTELIVVVAILGILAAIATPMVLGQITNAKNKTDIANAKTISNAYKIFMVENGKAANATAARTGIQTTLNPLPEIQNENNGFMINLETGDVIVVASSTTKSGYVDLGHEEPASPT